VTAGTEQRLAELTAQVAGLAEQVRGMAQRELAVELIFQAGFAAGQDEIRGPAGRPARRRAGRPRRTAPRGHLSVVEGVRR